jgi:hypothetical protein
MSFSTLFDEKIRLFFSAERNPLVTSDLFESTTDDHPYRQGKLTIKLQKTKNEIDPLKLLR